MHVVVATDGSLDPTLTATTATRLAGHDGRITVLSVVEVPRALLDEMRRSSTQLANPAEDPEYRSAPAGDQPATHWVGDDAFVDNYVRGQVQSRTSDLVAALSAIDAPYELVGIEGENAARSILDHLEADSVDFLMIGTHGLGRFDGMLGSTSTKLARRATCSVILVR